MQEKVFHIFLQFYKNRFTGWFLEFFLQWLLSLGTFEVTLIYSENVLIKTFQEWRLGYLDDLTFSSIILVFLSISFSVKNSINIRLL